MPEKTGSSSSSSIDQTKNGLPHYSKAIKLELPIFAKGDPNSWIFKANQFFYFHQVPLEDRVRIASFALDGEACEWFQWMFTNHLIDTWNGFCNALKHRFGPSPFEDYQGKLSKLIQTTSVSQYQHEFETLSNKIQGLSDGFLKSCFISGLKPLIQQAVLASQPTSLLHAINLAKLHG